MNAAETLRRLPPAELDAGLRRCIDDIFGVSEHVLTDDDYPLHRMLEVLADCLAERTLPPLVVVSKIASWTLAVMQWRARYAQLTDDELAIRAAAQRLWDALEGVSLD